MAPDDVNGFLGEHVGGKHLLKVPGHALVPPEVVAHLARAKLDGGAGDHARPVVHRLLPQPEEAVKPASCGKKVRMTVAEMPLTNRSDIRRLKRCATMCF